MDVLTYTDARKELKSVMDRVRLVFSGQAWADYLHCQATDGKTPQRLNEMIKQTMRTPFEGVGKPEPLKGDLMGWWSRRITKEDRMVYRLAGKRATQTLKLAQLRFHYEA